jgi:hypothetical protein
MAKKRKKKTLPKDFEERLRRDDLDSLKAVFDDTELDARGGLSKVTALSFVDCPDDLARWLVAGGAQIDAEDGQRRTPLEHRMTSRGRIDVLLELGCRVTGVDGATSTPLHTAVDTKVPHYVKALLDRGASMTARNDIRLTPLEAALQRCRNNDLPAMVEISRLMLERGAEKSGCAKIYTRALGETFEHRRASFNPQSVDEHGAALAELYALFDVPPVPRKHLHDGRSPIVARSATWEAQHEELWTLLVPSSGPAVTVQGEVIRISGRISDEIVGNGGVNWDPDYREMARSLVRHLAGGVGLPSNLLADAEAAVASLPGDTHTDRLVELAVAWVQANPDPIPLPTPTYRR